MKVATELWVPSEEGNGTYKKRKAKEVFDDLCEILTKEGLFPDEYFLLDLKPEQLFPDVDSMYCFAEWGGSEGIYLNVKILSYDEDAHTIKDIRFATGKTLIETTEAFDRMQYIAGYIYRLLMGDGQIHPRYVLIPNQAAERNQEQLLKRINSDVTSLIKQKIYQQQNSPEIYADELAIKLMILRTLAKRPLPEEIVNTLFEQNDILEKLSVQCKSIMKANYNEIEDILVSNTKGGIINEKN